MRVIRDKNTAKEFLTRTNVEYEATPALKERIEKLFGKELSVEQAVVHIIDDVRRRGDKALFELNEKVDGAKVQPVLRTFPKLTPKYCTPGVAGI